MEMQRITNHKGTAEVFTLSTTAYENLREFMIILNSSIGFIILLFVFTL